MIIIYFVSICLFKNIVKFLLINNSILVKVSSINFLLESFFVSKFSQIVGNFSQIFQRNEVSFFVIGGDENFVNLLS